MCDDPNSHQLLAVVSTVHHEGVGQSLNDRALCFSESLCGVSTGRVGDIDGGADLNVVTGAVMSVIDDYKLSPIWLTSKRCL